MNLVQHYAPWAEDSAVAECAVDGVVCCMRTPPDGAVEMVPVSEGHPLADCRHFLACHALPDAMACAGESIQAFYGRLGVVLLGTVMDGDCGIDTACMMLGLPQNFGERCKRREVADYLRERYDQPWMHQ